MLSTDPRDEDAMMSTATSAAPATAATPPAPTPAKTANATTIDVTESAAQEIAKQRVKRGTPEAAIRVGIRGGGCTGFTYVFEWAEEARATDKLIEAFGVKVVVDPKSFVYLRGMQLDFVKGMMGHGFKFNNPNAKGACGCGESVTF